MMQLKIVVILVSLEILALVISLAIGLVIWIVVSRVVADAEGEEKREK